jgi:hypothetical protein
VLTIIFAVTIGAIVFVWGSTSVTRPNEANSHHIIAIAAAVLSGALLLYFAQRWVDVMLWNAYRADMLIIIREATQRFLEGQNPYFTYRNTYDAPWDFVLSYGPLLWGPYIAAQLLQTDLRVVTIVGELFVPICCGIAVTMEATRGRLLSAAAWIVLLVIVLLSLDVPDYTLMGHTPVYWPLLPLFAALVTRRRWFWAAFALGLLVVARSTMVALVPIFLIAMWAANRRAVLPGFVIVCATVLLLLSPFLVWDAYAVWDGMVATYPRVMKEVVWTSTGTGATDTLGLTGWLLAHRLERLIEPSQLIAMPVVYGLAWIPILRGARPLPWMGLSLLVFSMTSLWPVFYIYYDVLLLFVSAALAETLDTRLGLKSWVLTLAVSIVLVAVLLNFRALPNPEFSASSKMAAKAFGHGPSTIALPRRSISAADIVIRYQARQPFDEDDALVTAYLNGKALWTARLLDSPPEMRFVAPTSVWRIGHNRLELKAASPDSTSPPLVVTSVTVLPRR